MAEDKKNVFPLEKQNFMIIAAGFVTVIIGLFLMSGGRSENPSDFNPEVFSFRRITLAPIVVLLGFVAVLVGIMKRPKE